MLCAACCAFPLARPSIAQPTVAGRPYTRLATRQETREAFLRHLGGSSVAWGRWFLLAPFDQPRGAKDIAPTFPPEEELGTMGAGAPGPDLARTFTGKAGEIISWHEATQEADIGGPGGLRPINLAAGLPPEQQGNAAGYLYRTIQADKAAKVPVLMGSDDGLRCWLNGRLIVDANVERALDPNAHQVVLDLRPGLNHLLVKVSQGAGEWEYKLTETGAIDPVIDAALDYRLDTDFPDAESRFYRLVTIPVPSGVELEVGGLDLMPPPDGRPMVSSRRGEVYLVSGAFDAPAIGARFTLFASGLQEPLGLRIRPDKRGRRGLAAYTAQRGELTRLVDTDGDDRADLFETVCADWQISGNYHEYAFGPEFDAEGNAWVNLNLAHTGGETVMGATVPTRGWSVKVTPEGQMIKVADGLRSPDGIGIYSDGQMFYTDNQGDFVATCKLSPLYPDSFQGHQASLRFRDGWADWKSEGRSIPDIVPAAVWFPYKKMGQSASDIMLDTTEGQFGPFAGQLFIGEQTLATVMRVCLEKVEGVYQGACFPFRQGFASGVHRLRFAPDGSLFVGMTDRGWGSTGPKRYGLQRLVWTGEVPFEILTMTAAPDGFDLRFTQDVDPATAADPASYQMSSYTYIYHPDYGSPEIDTQSLTIHSATLLDPRTVHLSVSPLREGYVHELSVTSVRKKGPEISKSETLLHPQAYYTLQRIPSAPH
jgi:hypothetical protein